MSRRRRRKFSRDPFEARVEDLSHDGRGVATHEEKKVFIHGALPGERVMARLTDRKRHFDEGEALEILESSPDRIEPECPHFGQCGGCSLQHLHPERQIEYKDRTLRQNLARIGKVEPEAWWAPLTGPLWGYRRRARLSVRYVHKKERVLVGFRERYGAFVADMQSCAVLKPSIASQLENLAAMILKMDAKRTIPQIEVACGDEQDALVFRHLEPLSEPDLETLRDFARNSGIAVQLQPKGPSSIVALEPASVELSFALPEFRVELAFGPSDFVQVNGAMNRRMVERAVSLLDPGEDDRVLDLFCGLGNFTLPLARRVAGVTGVEGEAGLVRRARENAAHNEIGNAEFHVADLDGDNELAPWARRSYDKVLLDPPRSGAEGIVAQLGKLGAARIVYVACHPGSLARDAGRLVNEFGYELKAAGVMDMFPHTAHVESIALFDLS